MYMLIWYFSNNLDICYFVGKMPEEYFSVWLFSKPGDKILFMLKFNEARISEWNVWEHFNDLAQTFTIEFKNILLDRKVL